MPWRSQLSRTPSDSKLPSEQPPQQPAITEINQWRRRIQPSRARTPVPSSDPEELFVDYLSPTTPRKKTLRPKLSSYFTQYIPTASNTSKPDVLSTDYVFADPLTSSLPSEKLVDVRFRQPEPEKIMESMMTRLMSDPFHRLDARDNSSLMMIFEAYRSLRDENAALADKLQMENECRYAGEVEVEGAEKRWQQEREDYKAEIKRLELLILKGKRGLVDVVRARQDSVLKRRGKRSQTHGGEDYKETVFEFLERTRVEDEQARKSQRAVLRPRAASPSQKMTALSHKFSMTSFHDDLPLSSVRIADEPMTLSQASYLKAHESARKLVDRDVQEAQQGHSMDTSRASSLTFSSFGDFLPDELEQDIVPPRLPANRVMIKGLQRSPAQKITTDSHVPTAEEEIHVWHSDAASKSSPLVTKSTVQQHKPTPLRLFPERSFSFDAGNDSISHRFDLAANDGVRSVVSSPQLPMSPGLTKIPSPLFDSSSLARPRREDSSSSFFTALRHSSVSQSSKSNRSSSESARTSGGSRLAKEKSSLRGKPMATTPGKVVDVANVRRVLGVASQEQELGMIDNGEENGRVQSGQVESSGDVKENMAPSDACLIKQRLVGAGFL